VVRVGCPEYTVPDNSPLHIFYLLPFILTKEVKGIVVALIILSAYYYYSGVQASFSPTSLEIF